MISILLLMLDLWHTICTTTAIFGKQCGFLVRYGWRGGFAEDLWTTSGTCPVLRGRSKVTWTGGQGASRSVRRGATEVI
jgi:hypothetical protein